MFVETNKIIELSECNLESKTLLTGSLLKWMDIVACLAGKYTNNTFLEDLFHKENTNEHVYKYFVLLFFTRKFLNELRL